jgi:serine/threonine protein kinase
MNAANLIGQTLDAKYKIERELGRGGMGAVYLATHLGTERAVALKVIAPEFMRREEFVERFRREARAAGRLRHPNVVDVTDFGLAETEMGRVAYLVMEYLDGCTLGEILEEEKRLPLSWTLDILEQTCAAVAEAHRQGIIHRDLKPDNIWLEPNSRGGYTVKVLDFGIAKLESSGDENAESDLSENNSDAPRKKNTFAFAQSAATQINESATLAFPAHNESHETTAQPAAAADLDDTGTAIFPGAARLTVAENGATNQEAVATQVLAPPTTAEKHTANSSANATSALTRVGAVLGTPLYMSPEQCRGERLDPRADVYSLGVIAYQMLAGETPFTGKYTDVLKAHQNTPAPLLEAKKVPRKVKKTIRAALSKSADDRPASATDFSSKLRASSEGITALLRRALVIYSEHLPTFLWLSFLLSLPIFLVTMARITLTFLRVENVINSVLANVLIGILGFSAVFVGIFFGSILLGVTTWIVAQLLAVPLRPVNWKKALTAAKTKWRGFAGTVTITTTLTFVGIPLGLAPGVALLVIGSRAGSFSSGASVALVVLGVLLLLGGLAFGVALFIMFYLVSPVVAMENLRGRAALKRSATLARRSLGTVTAAFFLSFLAPVILSAVLGAFVAAILKAEGVFKRTPTGVTVSINDDNKADLSADLNNRKENSAASASESTPMQTDEEKKASNSLKESTFEAIYQTLWFPILVLLSSLTSVITGLLYLKTRQSGGEGLGELLTEFEENDRTQKRWQLRLKERLVQSGRQTSRNTKKSGESGESGV